MTRTRAPPFARDHGLPGTASSDAHSVMELGVSQTVVEGHVEDAASLLAALAGATLITAARRTSCAWTPWRRSQRMRGNGRIVPGMPGPTSAVEP
ncbi:MAG: PHP-associated domain-containing protein [Chloroflexota bacterium]